MQQAAASLTGIPQPGIALPTTLASNQMQPIAYPAPRPQMQQNPAGAKQRVFTGSVTKLHDNFGFVDEDVFFQTRLLVLQYILQTYRIVVVDAFRNCFCYSCVKGNLPKVGDRVLVEASYNANMPFKWNATRIQVLPSQQKVSSIIKYGVKFSLISNDIYAFFKIVPSSTQSQNSQQSQSQSSAPPPLMSQTVQPQPGDCCTFFLSTSYLYFNNSGVL